MSKLRGLRAQLRRLRWFRRSVRLGSLWATAAGILLVALLAIFLVDWGFAMTTLQRALSMALATIGLCLAWRRYCAPFFGARESTLEAALDVERRHGIDSDLVAALQFESAAASGWGSRQLQQVVVDEVAERSSRLDVLVGLSSRQLWRRLAALAIAVAVMGAGVFLYPGHATAFLDRLLLRSTRYPTRTTIEAVLLDGKTVYSAGEGAKTFRSAAGKQIKLVVRAAGEMPVAGHAELQALGGGASTTVDLVAEAERGVFAAELPPLDTALEIRAFVGDAWMDPVTIEAIALPVVDVTLKAERPKYAAEDGDRSADAPVAGSRWMSVLEGSNVGMDLYCANKELRTAELIVDKKAYAFERSDAGDAASGGARSWQFVPKGTPLAGIREVVTYEIKVVDVDGLSPESPLRGTVRVREDRPPRVTAAMITRVVVPTARPTVVYGAADDHSLAKIDVLVRITRGADDVATETPEKTPEESAENPPAPVKPPERRPVKQLSVAGEPGADAWRGRYTLDLSEYELQKGDRLSIVLEAMDFRGPRAGKSARSEPLTVKVTDESGVLAALVESDQRSAEQLEAIIERQLGIGGK